MRFYHIALGFWLFSLTISMINGLGIFQYTMPTQNLDNTTGTVQITQLTNTMDQSSDSGTFDSIIGGFGLITQSLGYMKAVFIDSVCISCLASKYGIDIRISALFQAIYLFILIFGLYQFFTGRSTKGME